MKKELLKRRILRQFFGFIRVWSILIETTAFKDGGRMSKDISIQKMFRHRTAEATKLIPDLKNLTSRERHGRLRFTTSENGPDWSRWDYDETRGHRDRFFSNETHILCVEINRACIRTAQDSDGRHAFGICMYSATPELLVQQWSHEKMFEYLHMCFRETHAWRTTFTSSNELWRLAVIDWMAEIE